jgi:hypothetical protein
VIDGSATPLPWGNLLEGGGTIFEINVPADRRETAGLKENGFGWTHRWIIQTRDRPHGRRLFHSLLGKSRPKVTRNFKIQPGIQKETSSVSWFFLCSD